MSAFAQLTAEIAEQPGLDARLSALLAGLADRIKSTSNDQNVQKLSRELRTAAPELVRAVAKAKA